MSQNPHLALIDRLIATYRTLNMEVRPRPEEELRARGAAATASGRGPADA
jgi:hypothetical protein